MSGSNGVSGITSPSLSASASEGASTRTTRTPPPCCTRLLSRHGVDLPVAADATFELPARLGHGQIIRQGDPPRVYGARPAALDAMAIKAPPSAPQVANRYGSP